MKRSEIKWVQRGNGYSDPTLVDRLCRDALLWRWVAVGLLALAVLIAAPSAFAHGQDAGLLQPKRACNWEHRGEERTVLDGQRKVWIFWRCVCPYAEPPHGCHWEHIWTREVFNHAARRGHYHGNYVGMDLVGLRIHAFRKLELHDGAPVWHTYLPPQNVWCRAGRH